MHLGLYRSVMHVTYPDEAMAYYYAFQPIPAEELTRDGRLLSWTDDSGTEPFAVIETPDGSRVVSSPEGEWLLLIPEAPLGISVDEVYDLAMGRSFGLSVVKGPPPERHARESIFSRSM